MMIFIFIHLTKYSSFQIKNDEVGGHEHVGENRNGYRVLVWICEGKSPPLRHRRRWVRILQ